MAKKGSQPENRYSNVCFEEALAKLEIIVKQLENGDLALEEALTAFAEGVELSQVCLSKLNAAEAAVDKILRQEKGAVVEAPLVLGGEE